MSSSLCAISPDRLHWTHNKETVGVQQMTSLPQFSTLPRPIWTRGTHMWEWCSLTTVQYLTPLFPPGSEALGSTPDLCDWIVNFLRGRPQAVLIGSTKSSTMTLNTGPLLFVHNCVATSYYYYSQVTTCSALFIYIYDYCLYLHTSQYNVQFYFMFIIDITVGAVHYIERWLNDITIILY